MGMSMYRWWVLSCLLLLAVTYTARHSVAGNPTQDPLTVAKEQEASLQAVEWYTNESVRKALQAEATGDANNARLFGEKAIESDRKAKDIREQTAAAWLRVNETDRARDVWSRAAVMAEERANMLANRIPAVQQRWQAAAKQPDADRQELEIHYLQALLLTAQQWAVAADFHQRAGETTRATDAMSRANALLPALLAGNRLQALSADSRLANATAQVAAWQQQAASSVSPP